MENEIALQGGGRTAISRRGEIVYRAARPWSVTVLKLLRHLETVGFSRAPKVVGSGFDEQGRETLSFIEGEFVHPNPWTDEAIYGLGRILKELHDATASFDVPQDAVWRSWFGRGLGSDNLVIGHCDTGPWNIVTRDRTPVALIDWEVAGPVRRDIELAQACWLNAQLVDDDIGERLGLSSSEKRAEQVSLLLDGYGLARSERVGFFDQMLAFAVHDAAEQAIQA